jgi:hypothetical protein
MATTKHRAWIAAMTAMLAVISGASATKVTALPSYESDWFYYDSTVLLVGEEYRVCTGEHWTEGNPALAQPG